MFPVRVVSHPYPKGNGAAVNLARAANGDVLIFMDADGQHKPEDITAMLENTPKATIGGGRASVRLMRRAPGGSE